MDFELLAKFLQCRPIVWAAFASALLLRFAKARRAQSIRLNRSKEAATGSTHGASVGLVLCCRRGLCFGEDRGDALLGALLLVKEKVSVDMRIGEWQV